jgi:hypothetical protein
MTCHTRRNHPRRRQGSSPNPSFRGLRPGNGRGYIGNGLTGLRGPDPTRTGPEGVEPGTALGSNPHESRPRGGSRPPISRVAFLPLVACILAASHSFPLDISCTIRAFTNLSRVTLIHVPLHVLFIFPYLPSTWLANQTSAARRTMGMYLSGSDHCTES